MCAAVQEQVAATPLRLRDGSAVAAAVEAAAADWDGTAGATLTPLLANLGLRSLDRRSGLPV